jgi:hypothetical protein
VCLQYVTRVISIVAHRVFRGSNAFAKLVHLLYDESPDQELDKLVSKQGQLYKVFPYLKRPHWLRNLLIFIYFFGGKVVYPPPPSANTNLKQLVNDLVSSSHMLLSTTDSNENGFYSVFCLYIRRT